MRTMINLLPTSLRREQMLRKRLVQWVSTIAAVLVAGWGWHWYEMRENRELAKQLETLARQHAPTQTMLKQLIDMRQELVDVQQQETVAKELDGQRNALTLLGAISDAARRTKGRLRVTKFEINNFQSARGATDRTPQGKPPGLILSGVSLDNDAVGDFLNGLQKSAVFNNVELLTVKEREEKNLSLRDYEVRCDF